MSNRSAFKGKKIAIMVASGFNEEQFLIIQKTLLAAKATYTIMERLRELQMVGLLISGGYLIQL